MPNEQYKLIRKNIRIKGKLIIDNVIRKNLDPWNISDESDACCFCGSNKNITKEHVLPKWSFQNDEKKFFITEINNSKQTFMKTVIPTCEICNNETLSKIEKYTKSLLSRTDLCNDYFLYGESLNLIRWFELIEYKFHVLEFRRKFRVRKGGKYEPIFRDVPMSVMRLNVGLRPHNALAQLRKSQLRLKRKDKDIRYNSLVIYKSQHEQKLFFYKMDAYIYLSFPEYQMSMFYFYNEVFESNSKAGELADEIIFSEYGLKTVTKTA